MPVSLVDSRDQLSASGRDGLVIIRKSERQRRRLVIRQNGWFPNPPCPPPQSGISKFSMSSCGAVDAAEAEASTAEAAAGAAGTGIGGGTFSLVSVAAAGAAFATTAQGGGFTGA